MCEDEVRALLGTHDLRELAPVNTLEARVEAAPACDAVDVKCDLRLRQRLQLVVRQRQRLFDLAEDVEVPGCKVGLRHRTGVQDGPLLRQVLTRRQARGIESLLDELLFRLGPEEWHLNL